MTASRVVPGSIVGHHSILAEQAVDERALADIRAADDRDLDAGRLGPLLGIGHKSLEHGFEQGHDALIVCGGDGVWLAEPELVKLRDGRVRIEPFSLVDREPGRFAAAPRELCREVVPRCEPGAAVDQHDQPIGFGNGALGLLHHQALDRVGVLDQPARVDHDAGHLCAPRVAVLPIARQAREIRDQRIARAGERIEQGRFADVRPTDQCDHGQHESAYGGGGAGVGGTVGGSAAGGSAAAGWAAAGCSGVAGAATAGAAATATRGVAR